MFGWDDSAIGKKRIWGKLKELQKYQEPPDYEGLLKYLNLKVLFQARS